MATTFNLPGLLDDLINKIHEYKMRELCWAKSEGGGLPCSPNATTNISFQILRTGLTNSVGGQRSIRYKDSKDADSCHPTNRQCTHLEQ
jgi:hypothetical protein